MPPKIDHVKHVKGRNGRYYSYYKTLRKIEGRPVYFPLPEYGKAGFWESYGSCEAARNRKNVQERYVKDLCNDYQDSAEFDSKAAGTQKAYKVCLRQIETLLGDFPINDLTRADIQKVLDGEAYGAGKQNLFVAVISTIYRWGRRRNMTELHPTKDIEKAQTGTRLAWPVAVLEAGLTCADDRTRLAIALMFYTGQRIGDVCKMRWSDIAKGHISVVQQKTRKPLEIPIHQLLLAELDRHGKRGLTLLVGANGRPVRQDTIRPDVVAVCAAMGYPDLKPHGLRKNAVITLLEYGCTVAEVASITGQTFQVVEYYARQINQRALAGSAILKFEQGGNGKTSGKHLAK